MAMKDMMSDSASAQSALPAAVEQRQQWRNQLFHSVVELLDNMRSHYRHSEGSPHSFALLWNPPLPVRSGNRVAGG